MGLNITIHTKIKSGQSGDVIKKVSGCIKVFSSGEKEKTEHNHDRNLKISTFINVKENLKKTAMSHSINRRLFMKTVYLKKC
jgi:hypothetical protein